MKSNNQENKLLEEILAIEPELKLYKKEVLLIIKEMRKNNMNIKPNKDFVSKLQNTIKDSITEKSKTGNSLPYTVLDYYKKFMFSCSGVMAVLIIMLVVVGGGSTPQTPTAKLNFFTPQITPMTDNAFGVLSNFEVKPLSSKSADSGDGVASLLLRERKGDNGVTEVGGVSAVNVANNETTTSPDITTLPSVDKNTPETLPMDDKIGNIITTYSIDYQGENFGLDVHKMEVLKRVANNNWGINMGNFFQTINSNLFNWSNVGDLSVDYINLSDKKDFGYNFNVDFVNSEMSMYKNWEKWPNYYANCNYSTYEPCCGCLSSETIKTLDSDTVIQQARMFLEQYGVDLGSYGEPVINLNDIYYNVEDKSYVYDDISVTFPLVINNKMVYENFGNLSGVNVSYSLRENLVSGVYSLRAQNYQSSSYEIENRMDNILVTLKDFIENENLYMYKDRNMVDAQNETINTQEVKIKLGTPSLVYAKYWKYDQNMDGEYLVPAYAFPVLDNDPQVTNFYRTNVIIPLVSDFQTHYEF